MQPEPIGAGITAREREVLALVVRRLTNREIADQLGRSVRTVESHVSSLLGKFGVADRMALARIGPAVATSSAAIEPRLPRPFTSFVGRDRELDELSGLLESGPFVTLVGAPGVGKTRLAIEYARRMADDRSSGAAPSVIFCDLTPISDAALVADVVLAALDASPAHDRTARDTLLALGPGRQTLLVLDNCEHVVAGAADTAQALMASTSGIRILATSREPLGVDGEVTYPVHVLDSATPNRVEGEAPKRADSVRLFTDRATQARPDFRLEADDIDAVTEICRRLDGLPLAIELAAPRTRAFSVQQLEAALDDLFAALPPSARPDPSHSRTLRASIEWSHRALSADERLLFRRLSVFAGSVGLDAIESICSDAKLARRDAFGLLGSLADRSLVEVDRRAADGNRFRLLFPIRAFATDEAAVAGETAELQVRHARYYAARAEEAEMHLLGPQALTWVRRLRAEVDDIRSALRWSHTSGNVEFGFRIVAAIWPFWANYDRRREWMGLVIELMSTSRPSATATRARALVAAAELIEAWDVALATGFATEAVDLAQAIGDARTMASADLTLGQLLGRRPDRVSESRRRLEHAYAWFTSSGDRRHAGEALFGLGMSERPSEAIPRWMRARDLFAVAGDELGAANVLYFAGVTLVREQADLDDAEAMLLEALERAPRHGSEHEAAHARSGIAHLWIVRGNDVVARPLLEGVLPWFRASGDVRCTARCESLLGVAAVRSGAIDEARRAFGAAISDAARVADRVTLAECLDGLGSLLPPEFDQRALSLHAAASIARKTGRVRSNASGLDYSRSIRARRRRMGQAAGAAWVEGLSLAAEDAERLALSAVGPTSR